MMAKLVGKRINIGLSSDLDDRLNKISQMYGMSKSALCVYFIGQGVTSIETSYNRVQSIGIKDIESIINSASSVSFDNCKKLEDKKSR